MIIGVLVCAGPASARALLIAGSAAELPLAELSTDSVVARIAMPAPVTAVATSPSGALGYAAAGNAVVEIDIDSAQRDPPQHPAGAADLPARHSA